MPVEVVPVPPPTPSDLKRFHSKVRRDPNGCWQWTGAISDRGYGIFNLGGKTRRAHRVLYVWERGEPALPLDHTCRNRSCVNPDHLEPKTTGANVLCGVGPSAQNARKTECSRGHPFTPENTYVDPRGWRQCRQCLSATMERFHERRRRLGLR